MRLHKFISAGIKVSQSNYYIKAQFYSYKNEFMHYNSYKILDVPSDF